MKIERINDKVNNSGESIFGMVTTKIVISISIRHLIIYNEKNNIDLYNITISSVFILLYSLSVDLVGLIKKKLKMF